MRKFAVILSAILLVCALPVAGEDDNTTNLRIEVKTHGGKPVERASVVVRFVEGRSVAKLGKKIRTNWEMRTSQEGIAKMPSIPQGKVMIQVIAKGYQTFGQVFEVTEPEKTIEIKLNPPQAQYSSHQ